MYKTCLDMGLLPPNFEDLPANHRQTILLQTQMDAKALFTDLSYGAQSSAAGVAALLALGPQLQVGHGPTTRRCGHG